MSSVVNKGSTRFAPKIKQRRVIQPTESKPEVPSSSTTQDSKDKGGNEDDNEGSPGPSRSVSPFSKNGPLDTGASNGGQENNTKQADDRDKDSAIDDGEDVDGTELRFSKEGFPGQLRTSFSSSVASGQKRRSSVRLDSISSQRRMSISNRPSGAGIGSLQQQGRLVSMNKKNPQLLSANNDRTLQAMKRRRLSSTTSQKSNLNGNNKFAKPAKRISIISRASTSSEDFSDRSRKNSTSVGLDEEDPELTKYKISTISDIPKELTEDEGVKYHIDDSTFTMAELCKPVLPIGEISDNYHIAQEAARKKLEDKKKRRALRKQAREQFKPLKLLTKEEDDLQYEQRKLKQQELLNADVPEQQAPQQALQLKIGADGNIIIDEESTVVDRHANANLVNMHKERQDENTFANLYNTATYSKREYTDPWTPDEEVKLYKALSMWGTDFNLISQLFPYRTRRQVKLKFSLEERKKPILVELALKRKLPPDFEKFCLEIKKDIGTIEEFNLKLEELKKQHNEHMTEIQLAKETAKAEDNKKIQENIQNGSGGGYVMGSLDDRKVAGGFRESDLKSYRKTEIVLGTIDDMKRNSVSNETTV